MHFQAAEHGAKCLQARDQPEGGEREVGDDGEVAPPAVDPDRVHGGVDGRESTPQRLVERRPRLGERDAAPDAPEQLHPQLALETGHVMADRRLRQAQVRGPPR